MPQRNVNKNITAKPNVSTKGPQSRVKFDDQKNVNSVFKWVKENWSKPYEVRYVDDEGNRYYGR